MNWICIFGFLYSVFFTSAAHNISGKILQRHFLLFFQIHFIAYFHVCILWLLLSKNFYAVKFATTCFLKTVSFHRWLDWKILCKWWFCNASSSSKLVEYNKVNNYTPLDLKTEKETSQEGQNSYSTNLGLTDYNVCSWRTHLVEPELQLHCKEIMNIIEQCVMVLTSDIFVVMLCFPNNWRVAFALKISSNFMDLMENGIEIGGLRIQTFFIVATSCMCPCPYTHTRVCQNVLSDHKSANMPFKKIIKAENFFLTTIWFYKPFDCVWYRSNKDIFHLLLDWIFIFLKPM